MGKKNKQIEK
jgi:hypothetical protein